MKRITLTFATLFICACNQAEHSGSWPQFRGPNGSGVSDTLGLPVEFGPHTNLLWRTEVPFSHSSPILSEGRVFVTASEGDKLLTLSLDSRTGKVIWQREIVPEHTASIYKGNDPTSPTPVSDGEHVYVFFPDIGLISYGWDGEERFRLPLGPFNSFYGMGSSPVLAGDTLLLNYDQQGDSFLVAVDKNNGKVLWKTERPNRSPSYSTPILYSPEGGPTQVIVMGPAWLDAYSVETGERQWWMSGTGYIPKGVPIVDGNTLYVYGTGQDSPSFPPFPQFLDAYDADGDGKLLREEVRAVPEAWEHFGFVDVDKNGFIEAHEYTPLIKLTVSNYGIVAVRLGGKGQLSESDVLWRRKKTVPNISAPVLYDGVLYTVKDGGIIATLDPSTGEEFHLARSPEAIDDYYSSLVAADGKVYAVSETGKVTVLEAAREWKILAVNDLGADSYATPAIGDGRIYFRVRDAVYCFGARPQG